jgi:hypothetical protein
MLTLSDKGSLIDSAKAIEGHPSDSLRPCFDTHSAGTAETLDYAPWP